MNENTEITITIKDLAKHNTITVAILSLSLVKPINVIQMIAIQQTIIADIIENNSIKNSITQFDREVDEHLNNLKKQGN